MHGQVINITWAKHLEASGGEKKSDLTRGAGFMLPPVFLLLCKIHSSSRALGAPSTQRFATVWACLKPGNSSDSSQGWEEPRRVHVRRHKRTGEPGTARALCNRGLQNSIIQLAFFKRGVWSPWRHIIYHRRCETCGRG